MNVYFRQKEMESILWVTYTASDKAEDIMENINAFFIERSNFISDQYIKYVKDM